MECRRECLCGSQLHHLCVMWIGSATPRCWPPCAEDWPTASVPPWCRCRLRCNQARAIWGSCMDGMHACEAQPHRCGDGARERGGRKCFWDRGRILLCGFEDGRYVVWVEGGV